MRRGDISDLAAFVAIAEHLNFRIAGSRLGVTPSALSHTMRQLEERLGVRLLNRTTRSVSLTDAGVRLYERLRPAVDQISAALENLKGEHSRPFGRLRIYATHIAAAAVIVPVWGRFLSTYPDVQLELHLDEAPADIVALGFDAGIGPRDRAAADMIALRVTGPMRLVVVGAPSYFAKFRQPHTPDDLTRHNCIQYRRAADGAVVEWPFEKGGKPRRITMEGRITVNDPELALRAAVDGLGIAYTMETLAEPFLRSGQLVRTLEDWSVSLAGIYVYYPGHRQVPAALRSLIDTIRAARRTKPEPVILDDSFAAAN
jgi:DNA-binding transcriptional LysR family regulator